MKILFENYALDATITSINYSENYPPTNLTHPFLQKRYQNNGGDDTITLTFDDDKTINCLYFGYNNAQEEELLAEDGQVLTTEADEDLYISTATVSYSLKSLGGTVLYTGELALSEQFGAVHFDDVGYVRTIEITLSWSGLGSAGYLGGIGCGLEYDMPGFSSSYDDGYTDNSEIVTSPAGQTLQNFIEPFDVYEVDFVGVEQDVWSEIKSQSRAVGQGRPLWIDLYEESHDVVLPLYGTLAVSGVTRSNFTYSFKMTIQEAR